MEYLQLSKKEEEQQSKSQDLCKKEIIKIKGQVSDVNTNSYHRKWRANKTKSWSSEK